MDEVQQCQSEIRRLRMVIREMEEKYVEYPFLQGSKIFGVAGDYNVDGITYLPEQYYYIAPLKDGRHVIQALTGEFKIVRDIFKTKDEADKCIKNQLLKLKIQFT